MARQNMSVGLIDSMQAVGRGCDVIARHLDMGLVTLIERWLVANGAELPLLK